MTFRTGWKIGSHKCDRLAKYGSQYELPTVNKTVALGRILVGEVRKSYEQWKLDGLPYEKLLVKVKDYSRSRRLDNEAKRNEFKVHAHTHAPAMSYMQGP